MIVTVRFNIWMTVAMIGYILLIAPFHRDDSTPMLIESLFPENILLKIVVGFFSVVFGVSAFMFIVKALWNRLFPHLCGWKAINLAESYAISLLIGIFLIK